PAERCSNSRQTPDEVESHEAPAPQSWRGLVHVLRVAVHDTRASRLLRADPLRHRTYPESRTPADPHGAPAPDAGGIPTRRRLPMEIVTQVLADGPWHGGYGPPFPFWIFPLVWLLLIGGAVTAVVVRAEPEATCSRRPVAVDPWGQPPGARRPAGRRRVNEGRRRTSPDVARSAPRRSAGGAHGPMAARAVPGSVDDVGIHPRSKEHAMSTWTTAPLPSQTPQRPPSRLVARTRDLLAAHSVTLLRVSLGLVFVAFGIPKLVPGLSPAEDLASATIEVLTLGLVVGQAAVILTAGIETVIGLTL